MIFIQKNTPARAVSQPKRNIINQKEYLINKLVIHASVGLSTMITNIYVPKKKVANEILEQINKYKISAEKEQTADIK